MFIKHYFRHKLISNLIKPFENVVLKVEKEENKSYSLCSFLRGL